MKTGITGATGKLGHFVVEKLKEKLAPEDLVALVRTPGKAADLGIEARVFDYDKPETLRDSLKGIDHLFLISGNEIGKRKQQHENVIRAAQKAGIKWFVYTSLLHTDTSSLILAAEHLITEELLKTSGLPYTILRNGWYTENYTDSAPQAVSAEVLIGSAGTGKISSAARADYAEAAAIILSRKGEEGKTYELAGDEAYTLADLAAEISRQTGKNIPYKNLTESEYVETLEKNGLPESVAKMIANMDIGASKNDLFDESKQLSKLLGRPTTPLSETIKKALA